MLLFRWILGTYLLLALACAPPPAVGPRVVLAQYDEAGKIAGFRFPDRLDVLYEHEPDTLEIARKMLRRNGADGVWTTDADMRAVIDASLQLLELPELPQLLQEFLGDLEAQFEELGVATDVAEKQARGNVHSIALQIWSDLRYPPIAQEQTRVAALYSEVTDEDFFTLPVKAKLPEIHAKLYRELRASHEAMMREHFESALLKAVRVIEPPDDPADPGPEGADAGRLRKIIGRIGRCNSRLSGELERLLAEGGFVIWPEERTLVEHFGNPRFAEVYREKVVWNLDTWIVPGFRAVTELGGMIAGPKSLYDGLGDDERLSALLRDLQSGNLSQTLRMLYFRESHPDLTVFRSPDIDLDMFRLARAYGLHLMATDRRVTEWRLTYMVLQQLQLAEDAEASPDADRLLLLTRNQFTRFARERHSTPLEIALARTATAFAYDALAGCANQPAGR